MKNQSNNNNNVTKYLVIMATVVVIMALGGLIGCLSLYDYLEQKDNNTPATTENNMQLTVADREPLSPDSESANSETSETAQANQPTHGSAGVSQAMREIMRQATTESQVTEPQTTDDFQNEDSSSTASDEEVQETENTKDTEDTENTEDTEDALPLIYGKGYIEQDDFGGRFKNNALPANEKIAAVLELPDYIFKDKSVNRVKVVCPAKVKKGKSASIKVLVTTESGQQYFTRLKFKAKEDLVLSRTSDEKYDSVMAWNGNRLTCYFVTTATKKLLKLPSEAKYKNNGNSGILKCTFVREEAE